MKYSIYGFFTFLLVVFVISACNKYGNLTGLNGQLVATSYNVKIDQPDSLELVGAKVSDSLKWSIVPSGYDTLITRNNTAQIEFTKAGSYTVKVSDNGAIPATTTITVNSAVYVNPNKSALVPLTGDQITLTPNYFKNKAGDTSYIYFIAKTTDYYCASGRLVFSYYLDVYNNFTLSFTGVQQLANCNTNTAALSAGINFNQHALVPLANGTYPLTVNLNGTTYIGNIVVASTTISFDWKYTSGVMISPQQISK
jgi:hypothetical protein